MPRRLQLDDQAIVAAYLTGTTQNAIARQFGVSRSTVQQRLRQVTDVVSRRQLAHGRIVAAYQAGSTMTAIAHDLGLTRATVARALRLADIPSRPKGVRPRLDQRAVVAAYADGETVGALSKQWAVSPAAVSNLLRRAGIARRPRGGPRTRTAEGSDAGPTVPIHAWHGTIR